MDLNPHSSFFADIAELTKDREEPLIRIAHLVRQHYLGHPSAAKKLKQLIESGEPEYTKIFREACWL